MAFPQPFLDALTERNPIDEVVGQYVSLTRRGSNLFGLCPFHSEKTASFSVAPDVRPLPRSLQNIFRELHDDVGQRPPASGDLTPWTENGVLLLNRVLTVRLGEPGSHRGIGWEAITAAAITALVARPDAPLVAILWGRDAQSLEPDLPDVPVIASAHPSPMSADRGFFGSRPFSRANALLDELGAEPLDWSLP